jgi:acetyl-CoA acetyltransferase
MREVVVLGAEMTRFTKTPERSVEDLGREAVIATLADAGVEREHVQAAIVGSLHGHPGLGQRVLKDLGMTGIPIVNVENACASGSTAVREAFAWIRGELADVVLVIGVESLTAQGGGLVDLGVEDHMWGSGLVLPAIYALQAKRHMHLHGVTREQFAQVAVKSHANAMRNPKAHFHKPVTVDQVLGSPLIADPITLFQCCPNTDGAAAAVLASDSAARRFTSRPVRIAGSALGSGRLNTAWSEPELTSRTAAAAYAMAGVAPEDVDVAEVHDAFAPGELLYYEELGFCGHGEGGEYVERGRAEIGGDGVAVNPSGGLLSRGHPFGATGLAQIAELTAQLRGTAGDRQVDGARVGVAHTMGGTVFELEANACAVHVLTA